MKKTLWSMMLMVMTLFSLGSCMSDDEVETSSECAILSFSVGSITSYDSTKKYDSSGNATDTIITKTIGGSEIFFNIDQVNGRIYSIDSLPNWVNLKAVVPSFSGYGNVYLQVDEATNLYYSLTSGKDSVDFRKKVRLLCVSTDNTSSRFYDVEINRHVGNTDTLEWKSITSNLAISGQSKALTTDGKVFLFAQNESGESVMTYAESGDAQTWSTPVTVPVDYQSVVLFNEQFYGLDNNGNIYTSPADQLATTWTKASNQKVERLLAADKKRLYAYDGNAIIGSSDLDTWTLQGMADLDMLPETSINSTSHPTSTNSDIEAVVMTGISNNNSEHAVTWYKVSSTDETTDQPWAYIQVTADNPYGLHHLDNLSTTYYNGALFAIGAESGTYKYLYRSDDNGITWHPQTEMYPMPDDLDPANGAASIVTAGTQLWIIQENGTVWLGSIQ